jgi:hypothetical protein
MKHKRKLTGMIGLLIFSATQVCADTPQIPTGKLTPVIPAQKTQIKQESLTEGQKKSIKQVIKPRVKVLSAETSWTFPATSAGWCSTPAADRATMQVTTHYTWPGESVETRMPVQMVVRTPMGLEKRQNRFLYGGAGRPDHTDISQHFEFTQSELCRTSGPQLCMQIRYAPVVAGDSNRLDQVWKRVCSAW